MDNIVDTPSVGVVVPCYNGRTVLARTLDSLLRQTQLPDEILVVDDGSSDESGAFAEAYGPPVRVVRQRNQGAAVARYTGVCTSAADILVFTDCGDVSQPNRIKVLIQALQSHTGCIAAFASVLADGRSVPPRSSIMQQTLDATMHVVQAPLKAMLERSVPLASGMNVAVRRSTALERTRVDPFYRAANDLALQLQLAAGGEPWVYVASATLECEMLPDGISHSTGWTLQKCYALCAIIDSFESGGSHPVIDRAEIRQRVEDAWPSYLLYMYLRGNYRPLRRVLGIGLRYGRLKALPRALWWALRNAEKSGDLDQSPLLRQLVRRIRRMVNDGPEDQPPVIL